MRLPGFDVIFRLAAPAIIIFVEPAGVALHQIGDDEACVGPLRAGLDAGDDALDAAPARGPVVKLFVTARLRSGLSRWPRDRRCGVAMSWSAPRRGCNRAR